MSTYYSKIRVCDYCKDLNCEIVMIKDKVLGYICPLCAKTQDSQLKNTIEKKENIIKQKENIIKQKEQIAIEIETY